LRGAAGLGLAAATGTLLPACGKGGGTREEPRADAPVNAASGKGTAEPPPETTRIRLPKMFPVSCAAAIAVAEPFLREEGFTDVEYLEMTLPDAVERTASGVVDFAQGYAAAYLPAVDAGAPIVMLSGLHVGCWQVFAAGGVRSISDFKGRTIAIPSPGPELYFRAFLAATLANVGIDLRRDVTLVGYRPPEAAELLTSGRVDGLLALPPLSLDLRAKGIGTVVLNSSVDRPWSGYFCCMASVNRAWMERHPVATRRALRAVLRAADVTAKEPDRAARVMVDGGFTDNFAYACENLRELPHDVWRRFDPADTIRFYALRMKEAGLVKGTPEQLLERGCDFRHLAGLKQEL
jgi:NitT/TauT family transport system substrate-binding protein